MIESSRRRRKLNIAILIGTGLLILIALFPGIAFSLYLASLFAIDGVLAKFETCEAQLPEYPTDEQTQLVDRSLVTGVPCEPPCWQGLTPGQSNLDEALETLHNNEYVDPLSIEMVENHPWTTIRWTSTSSSDEFISSGTISLRLDESNVIQTISVRLDYQLAVQELFDTVGPPSHVYLVPWRYYAGPEDAVPPCDNVGFVWLDHGLRVELLQSVDRRSLSDDGPPVSPDWLIGTVEYFAPVDELAEYEEAQGSICGDCYQEWKGFDNIAVPEYP